MRRTRRVGVVAAVLILDMAGAMPGVGRAAASDVAPGPVAAEAGGATPGVGGASASDLARGSVAAEAAGAAPGAARSAAAPALSGVETDACGSAARAPFLDVAGTSVHADAVDCLRWYEIAAGTAVDAFSPAAPVRRDQLATFLARTIAASTAALPGSPPPAPFPDVGYGVHRPAIDALAALGIVEARGEPTGAFQPRAPATRAEAAAQLTRAHAYIVGEPAPIGAPDAFADDDGHAAEAWINAAAALGLVEGTSPTTFEPEALLERDQMASLLTRLLDRVAAAGRVVTRPAGYRASIDGLPARLRAAMTGVSWHPGCPVPFDDLRLLSVVHRAFDGRDRVGLLVVHEDVADNVAHVFGKLYESSFAIARMELVLRHGGDDGRSMAANNTSAFNCRTVAGTSVWSQHSYGWAIDINPRQNPYVRGSTVQPPAGRAYVDRGAVRPGMAVRPGPATAAFDAIGWGWGGDWNSLKDYQHFSATGR